MRPRAYAIVGAFVLGFLAWAHFTGWAPSAWIQEEKGQPKTVRGSGTGSYTRGK